MIRGKICRKSVGTKNVFIFVSVCTNMSKKSMQTLEHKTFYHYLLLAKSGQEVWECHSGNVSVPALFPPVSMTLLRGGQENGSFHVLTIKRFKTDTSCGYLKRGLPQTLANLVVINL